jgi:hypothetical protein
MTRNEFALKIHSVLNIYQSEPQIHEMAGEHGLIVNCDFRSLRSLSRLPKESLNIIMMDLTVVASSLHCDAGGISDFQAGDYYQDEVLFLLPPSEYHEALESMYNGTKSRRRHWAEKHAAGDLTKVPSDEKSTRRFMLLRRNGFRPF